MKGSLLACLLVLQALALPVLAGGAGHFEGGSERATASLGPPAFTAPVNLSLPAECFVLGATVNLTGLSGGGEGASWPRNVTLSLEGSELWAFRGRGCGELGRQTLFEDGAPGFSARFGPAGGSARTAVRLPLGARVTNASLEVECSGPERLVQLAGSTGPLQLCTFGSSVSAAGDFNGDGYDDLVVGAPQDPTGGTTAGRAFLFLGGPAMDLVADLTFTGGAGDLLGHSVAGAGDLNGDGYDDLAVGASRCGAVASEAGRVLVYFGGADPDGTADAVLDGSPNERLGAWVDGLGDLNGDGYDDLAVSADTSNISGDPGRAYVFLGGSPMNRTPALRLTGEAAGDYFGWPAVAAGDLNGDGFADLAVGAILNDAVATNAGSVYVFLGGTVPDGEADLVLRGTDTSGWLGYSVSGVGDFDGDGFDDLLAGAPNEDLGGYLSGVAYLLRGGPGLDNVPDLKFVGAAGDRVGHSASGAGDVNGDGYADVITGAPFNSSAGSSAGAARVFYGGGLDNLSDIVFLGSPGDSMGWPVAGAGNVNGDGLDDLVLGMPYSDLGGTNAGRVLVLSQGGFVTAPGLRLNGTAVWEIGADFAGTRLVSGLAGPLNRYLAGAPTYGSDVFGNLLADVPLQLFAGGEGELVAGRLDIRYDWKAPVHDFSGALNSYIRLHRGERDASGNLTVPLEVRAGSAGRVDLSGLELRLDVAPVWTGGVPPLRLDEDTAAPRLLDLLGHFRDDFTAPEALGFGVASVDPPGPVGFDITDGHYLSADALSGDANDNWTGALTVVVSCTDGRGLLRLSDPFAVTVAQVNDAPAVTSAPVLEAFALRNYEYRLTAVDAEGDRLLFGLASGPEGMAVDRSSGILRWRPEEPGAFPVSVSVSDAWATSYQNFTLHVSVINKPPWFVSVPVTEAPAGLPYEYQARAVDPDGDALEYSLLAWPSGMSVGRTDGRLSWAVPRETAGNFSVVVKATDGKGGEDRQEFSVGVRPFARPSVAISAPAAGRTVSGKYLVSGTAQKGTLDIAAVRLRIDGGEWMNATGNATWGLSLDTRVLRDGPHLLEARASDGTTFSDTASVRFDVDNGGQSGVHWMAVLPAAVLLVLAVAAAAALARWRRRTRRPKKYDWGPD